MRHRSGARPVGIILMPDHYAAVTGGFDKKLVVPETYRAAQNLGSRNCKSRMPEQIVKALRGAPRAERVKQNLVRVGGFVQVIFVKKLPRRMRRIHQFV